MHIHNDLTGRYIYAFAKKTMGIACGGSPQKGLPLHIHNDLTGRYIYAFAKKTMGIARGGSPQNVSL